MKRLFLLVFSAFLGFAIAAQTANGGFELTVKIANYPAGAKLSLGRYYADKQYLVDSAVFDKQRGVYVFKRDTQLEGGMHMLISFENMPAEIIIDQNQQFSIEMSYPDFGANMKFTNSPENQMYQDFNAKVRAYYMDFEKVKKEFDSMPDKESPEAKEMVTQIQTALKNVDDAKTQFITDNPKHLMSMVFKSQKEVLVLDAPADVPDSEKQQWRYNYWKDHYFDNIDFSDDRILRTPIFHAKLEEYSEKVLSPHPDSIKFALERLIEKARPSNELFKYVIWWSVDKYQRSQIIGYDAIWVYLAKKYYVGGEAFWASQAIVDNFKTRIERLEPLLIGNIPTEFYCPDTNADRPNEQYRSVFEAKSRYTIVIFWEPSCGHCKKQMPILRDFYNEKHKELDFEVFAVCRDHDINSWKNYIYTNKMTNWINVNGKASNVKYDELWEVNTTPTIYVLDSQHRIVTKRIEADQIEPFLRNWNAVYYDKK
ncbi:MAG: DUF5106 domain-containing protein [Bacteroidales bacterium]|nr:DUF5106 domain-containing protein [Bacteroidales bacterium]